MSEWQKYDSESMGEIRRILADCHDDFGAAREMIADSIRANLQEAGQTPLGESYAEGVRPGAFATAALLDMLEEELDFTGGAAASLLRIGDQVVDDTINIVKGDSGGGRW